MKTGRAQDLAQRQRELLVRSAQLRVTVAGQVAVLRRPLALADEVRAGWMWMRRHPEWPIGAAVVVVLVRPRRAWRWGWRLWSGWRLWRRVQRQLTPGA